MAFDASKGSSHCQGYCSFGKPSSKPIKAAHSRSGMAAVEGISETLEQKTGTKSKVVMESTGVYSKPVIRWAETRGMEVYLISPLESAKVRKSRLRPTKTDALDCGVIAEVAYTRGVRKLTAASSLYSQVYSLSRRRAVAVGRLIWSMHDEKSLPLQFYLIKLSQCKSKTIAIWRRKAKGSSQIRQPAATRTAL